MGLLREIQADAIDSSVDVSNILRKCLILAYKLKHEPLKQWVGYELNGYPGNFPVPDYRIVHSEPRGSTLNAFGHLSNLQVPRDAFPDDTWELMTTMPFRHGIGHLQGMAGTQDPKVFFPIDLVQIVNTVINPPLHEMYLPIPLSFFGGLFDAIRNRLLSFSLMIESENPEADQVAPGVAPISQDKVGQIFNTTIYGGQTAIGDNANFQNIAHQVISGDLDSLLRHLRNQGIGDEELADLEEILRDSSESEDIPKEGGKIRRWATDAAKKTAGAGWQVAQPLIIESVKRYLGL